MARETLAELKEIIAAQEKEIASLQPGNVDGQVVFARDPEQLNSVVLITPVGVFTIPADQWMEAIGQVSMDGKSLENASIIRKLHLG